MRRELLFGLTAFGLLSVNTIYFVGLAKTSRVGYATLSLLIDDDRSLAAGVAVVVAAFGMCRIGLVFDNLYVLSKAVAAAATSLSVVEIVMLVVTTFVSVSDYEDAHIGVIMCGFGAGTMREIILLWWRWRQRPPGLPWRLWANALGVAVLLALIVAFLALELSGPVSQDSGAVEISMFDVLIVMTPFHVVELGIVERMADKAA